MLPTTNKELPTRQGTWNRFKSARNKSVIQKAGDMVSSSLSWSSRNATENKYNDYKKHDSNSNSSNHSITIDTGYLSKNIKFSNDSKNSWHKLSKKANRQFLDKPWLLPTLVGSSFAAAIIIIFMTMFSSSSTHQTIQQTEQNNVQYNNNNDFNYQERSNEHQYKYDVMHKKSSQSQSSQSQSQRSQRSSSYAPKQSSNQYNDYNRNNQNNNYNNNNVNDDNNNMNDQSTNRFSMKKSVDYVFSLFHSNDANRWNAVSSLTQKYCIDLPHFTLENEEATSNLKGNLGTLIFDIVKYNPIYTNVNAHNVLITKKGTFIAQNPSQSRTSNTVHCDLVSHLFGIADDLSLLKQSDTKHHDFDTDASTFWDTHKSDINHQNINEDVNTLFEYANDNKFYEISMELPKLVEKHCYHTKHWISNIGDIAEENFYNSLSRAIFTVNNAETSEISDNVIGFPVIDSNGDLMQLESGILEFNKHDIESQKHLHYSRCELLDKIVFHGLSMSMNKHIDFMYEAAKKDDFYGFEVLADLLDTQYCNIINDKLNENARNNLGLHLWSMTKDIINGDFILFDSENQGARTSQDFDESTNEYIITTDGGIMHSNIATNELKIKKSQIIHCSLIKQLIKRGIKYHSGNTDYYNHASNNNINNINDANTINEFEHRYDQSGLSNNFNNEMKGTHNSGNNKQLTIDASNLINHLKNGQETEFITLLDYLLDQYHSQWFDTMTNNDIAHKRSVKLMIEQTVHSVILGNVNLSTQYDPKNDLTILRKNENELEIIHKNDFTQLSNDIVNNLERLPLLDEIFKQIVNNS